MKRCTPLVAALTALTLAVVAPVAPAKDAPAAAAPAARIAAPPVDQPLIQLAILLDTSNSMDGLIDQAKRQLWTIVNQFVAVQRDGRRPLLQVALFEYGNDGLAAAENHIRLVLPLTDDLDKVSQELFALKTNGGQEYCGAVVKAAVDRLTWSKKKDDLKVIFIAGNEPFSQGPINYSESCKAAITRGIQVNTIFCGAEAEGIATKWKDGAVLADGRFMSIDQNTQVVQIETPFDKEIAELGVKINETFVAYGKQAQAGAQNQAIQDANAAELSPQSAAGRAVTKGSANYRNSMWCLVDAVYLDNVDLAKVKEEDLPENMRKMNMEERKAHLAEKKKQREAIAKQIKDLDAKRQTYIIAEQQKLAEAGIETFDKAVIDSVRKQAEAKKFEFIEPKSPSETAPQDAPKQK